MIEATETVFSTIEYVAENDGAGVTEIEDYSNKKHSPRSPPNTRDRDERLEYGVKMSSTRLKAILARYAEQEVNALGGRDSKSSVNRLCVR